MDIYRKMMIMIQMFVVFVMIDMIAPILKCCLMLFLSYSAFLAKLANYQPVATASREPGKQLPSGAQSLSPSSKQECMPGEAEKNKFYWPNYSYSKSYLYFVEISHTPIYNHSLLEIPWGTPVLGDKIFLLHACHFNIHLHWFKQLYYI